MLRKILTGCFISSILLGCTFFTQVDEMPKPEAEAKAVWKYITDTHPFEKWPFWPDHQGTYNSKGPHGPKHKIYVNQLALDSKKRPLQNGSMVVKYNLSPADEVKAVTIMYKVKGYNPAVGDWFWAQYSPTGEVQEAGKPEKCIACHLDKAENDYILVHEFDK